MRNIPKNIIEMAAAGDTAAFEEIYKSFSSTVYTLALNITRNRQDAEEATQDVFMKIYRGLKGFRFSSSFSTWAYRIAVNTAINKYRARSRRTALTAPAEDISVLPDTAKESAKDAIERQDAKLKAAVILENLSAEHRSCIVLREIEGLDYKEMSEVLGIPLNTVRSRLKRAREALIAMVQKEGGRHEL